MLKAEKRRPEDLNAQIQELLGKLPTDVSIWNSFSTRYSIDLFCGLFMSELNEGLSISSESIKALGERSILLGLDIYAPPEEEADTAP